MDELLQDIRMLKLAELHERAYEEFVLDMAERYVHDPGVRSEVRKLVSASDGHGERIAELLRELSAQIPQDHVGAIERAALLDILEVEKAAREFYLRHVDQVHEPRVAKLFHELAAEEGEHVRIAEAALGMSDRRYGKATLSAKTQETLRMLAEPTPLWEGTSEPRV